jgi:tRNA threonylcarbamoyl adenosine modification protein (Sua5/YciO/YrdC/YwlC family)
MASFSTLLLALVAIPVGVTAYAGAGSSVQPLKPTAIESTTRFVAPGGSSTCLFGQRMKNIPPQKIVSQTEFVQVNSDGSDAWRTMSIVEILKSGGVGVLPTDTGYGFVTLLDSKKGVERLLRIKDLHEQKKPLSLLCKNLSVIDQYCVIVNKKVFKILKNNLPGPYTFILPSVSTNRGIIFDSKGHKHSWKRDTVGIRIPNDPVLRYIQDELLLDDTPLVVSSLHTDEEEDDSEPGQVIDCRVDVSASWCKDVDFIVDAGVRPYSGSTVFDMTGHEPIVVREGLGLLDLKL